MRYTLEFFSPLIGQKSLPDYLKQVALLQDDLGMLNDLEVAQGFFQAWSVRNPHLREAGAFVRGWHAPQHAVLGRSVLVRATDLLDCSPPWRKLNKLHNSPKARKDGDE
jgi:hypothetical protein